VFQLSVMTQFHPHQQVQSLPIVSQTDLLKCTNCKTCYQDIPELFQKTRIVVNGEAREAGSLIPGVLERVTVTPELRWRV
jgi:pyruvate-ferredoxin/flavodoxin oxidoreductase